MNAKTTFKTAHRQARINRSRGQWLHNPIRIADGYPGLFVGADGQLRSFAGFSAPELFRIGR